MRTMVGAVAAALAIGVVGAAPVEAAPCTYTYNEYGYPQWSDTCGTGMAPGRIGPLRMGVTTVARARSLDVGKVVAMVNAHIEPRQCGLLGEPRVSVLQLNAALDALR